MGLSDGQTMFDRQHRRGKYAPKPAREQTFTLEKIEKSAMHRGACNAAASRGNLAARKVLREWRDKQDAADKSPDDDAA